MRTAVYMVLTGICLGLIGVFVKLIGHAVPVMTLNFLRVFIGFIFLLIWVPSIDRGVFHISRRDWGEFALMGFLIAVSFSLYNAANLYAPIANVVLLNYTYPFFVSLLAYFFLGERITRIDVMTLIVAFSGIALINPIQPQFFYGSMLCLVQAAIYAVLITYMRFVDRTHGIGVTLWFLFFASLFLLPFPFIYGLGDLSSVLHWIILLGCVCTGLAYILYNLALEEMEAHVASMFAMLVTPLIAISTAFLVLNEEPSANVFLGGFLILSAGLFHMRKNKKL
jgi:drug/metabolite transporter (DMT)-like permease